MAKEDARARPRLHRWLSGLLAGSVLIVVASGLVTLIEPYVSQLAGLPPIYLLVVLPVALRWGAGPGIAVAVESVAVFAYLFVPPRWSFAIADLRYGVSMALFLIVGVSVAWLAARSRRDERESARLSQEQAGLRRVATLVAGAAQPREVFAAVSDEIARLLEPDLTMLVRLESDGSATFLAGGGWRGRGMRVGRTVEVPRSLMPLRDGGVVRIDDLRQRPDMTETVERQGLLGVVGCPIVVEGRVWGAFGVGSRAGAFPASTEQRLVDFTELIATAIANAESRAEITRLLDEQAALRRVATVVAQGAAPQDVFAVAAEEVAGLLGVDVTFLVRMDTATIVAAAGWAGAPIGAVASRNPMLRQILERGEALRLDDVTRMPEGVDILRGSGIRALVASPVTVEGRLWGVLGAGSRSGPLPVDAEQRLVHFTDLVAMAIGNAENQAQLAASRARVVAASDDARRRIERDLHDGAQQRIVSLGLELRLAQAGVPEELPEVRAEIGRVADDLGDVLEELREMARGIHPAMLSEGGLRPALRTLARRAPVPVELDIATDTRFPEVVEIAAYYVVSESLTNAVKHAKASRIAVSMIERDGALRLSVRDDGVGGADPQGGSGLIGLRDRVEALGGRIDVDSPRGAGTIVLVSLPVDAGSAPLSAARGT